MQQKDGLLCHKQIYNLKKAHEIHCKVSVRIFPYQVIFKDASQNYHRRSNGYDLRELVKQ
jgi:hypothetical protein